MVSMTMIAKLSTAMGAPTVKHEALHTTFTGIVHPLSTEETPVHQFRGIKFASIPARFRQSRLLSSYPPITDATHYGPVCPQYKFGAFERELFDLAPDLLPQQTLKQDEFECLNLNITTPAGLNSSSQLPVMLWVHGGGNRGSGSSWLFDGGAFVQKSIHDRKPVILVTFNYRLGLLGYASSPALRDDNRAAGEEGAGNYGLRDQRKALEWVYHFISDFGGNPDNITLFGESSGAADILCHLNSTCNERTPLFQRAIVQSAMMEVDVPNVHSAGWQLSRTMSSLRVQSIEDLRKIDVERLVRLGQNFRATDDGVFFRKGWKESLYPEVVNDALICNHVTPDGHLDVPEARAFGHQHRSHSRVRHLRSESRSRSRTRHQHLIPPNTRQPIIIGDCGSESLLWSLPASLWNAPGLVRRVRAVCQSLNKSTALMRAYEITAYTPADELPDRVLELINDARFAWPTDCIAKIAKAQRGGRGVWRYVFDQESPSRGVPHHGVDLMYLFGTVPVPSLAAVTQPDSFSGDDSPEGGCTPRTPEMFFGSDSSSEDGRVTPDYGFGCPNDGIVDDEWGVPVVDEYSYNRVRDAIHSRWLTFAYGESPWKEDKVYVFGPEGETGERSMTIFDGRRRTQCWKEALEPLGMQVVQKVGMELSNGPPLNAIGKY